MPTYILHSPFSSVLPSPTRVARSYSSAFTAVKVRCIKASVQDPDPPVSTKEKDSNTAMRRVVTKHL